MDKQRIAEAYLAAPLQTETGNQHSKYGSFNQTFEAYRALAQECMILAGALRMHFHIIEVERAEPYKTAADMFEAIENNRFEVSNLYCDHPLWTPNENVAFRIVHDRFGHYGRNGDNQSGFSWAGELAAYESQSRFHSEVARRALFTEIVGQTACYSLTGEFPEQKAILLPEELNV